MTGVGRPLASRDMWLNANPQNLAVDRQYQAMSRVQRITYYNMANNLLFYYYYYYYCYFVKDNCFDEAVFASSVFVVREWSCVFVLLRSLLCCVKIDPRSGNEPDALTAIARFVRIEWVLSRSTAASTKLREGMQTISSF